MTSTPSPTLTPDGDEVEIRDFDAVCVVCRWKGGHARGCTQEDEPWPTIRVSATPAIRDQAFEEAARVADRLVRHTVHGSAAETESDAAARIARNIRALKGTSPTDDGGGK